MAEEPRLLIASQYDTTGSSTRVRAYDWLDHLDVTGYERFEYRGTGSNSPAALARDPRGTFRAEHRLRALAERAQGRPVLLSRELSPLSSGRSEAALLRAASVGVYDFDDALYTAIPGSLISRIHSRRTMWRRSVEAADVVFAGSEILAGHAERHSSRVQLMPSVVEPTRYTRKRDYALGETAVAVWIGSPGTEPYLRHSAEGLLAAHRETGLRLRVVSRGNASLGALDAIVDRVDWTPDGFSAALADADLGIMPLPDDEWTRGKCAYKLLQYGASAVPVIGSAVGTNITALQRLGGVQAGGPAEWRDALIDMVRATPADRAAAGRAAHDGVVRHYSFEAWAPVWRAAVLA